MKRSAVSSGRLRYPVATPSPPMQISPATPTGTGLRWPSSMYTWVLAIGRPMGIRPAQFCISFDLIPRGEGCCFRWPIDIHEPLRRAIALQDLPHRARIAFFASKENIAHVAEDIRTLVHQLVEQRRGHKERRHPMPGKLRRKALRGQNPLPLDPHKPAPVQQRSPDLKSRRIKTAVGNLRHNLLRPQPHIVAVDHQPVDRTVGHTHSLGRPR